MRFKKVVLISAVALVTVIDSSFAMQRRSPSPVGTGGRSTNQLPTETGRRQRRSPSPVAVSAAVAQTRPANTAAYRPVQRPPSPEAYGARPVVVVERPHLVVARQRPVVVARPRVVVVPAVQQVVQVVGVDPLVDIVAYINALRAPRLFGVDLNTLPRVHQILLDRLLPNVLVRLAHISGVSQAEANARDPLGRTALHRVMLMPGLTSDERVRLAQELRRRGANMDLQDGDRVTALHLAVANRDVAMINWLNGHGARLLRDRNGFTPYDWALHLGYLELLPSLQPRAVVAQVVVQL